MEFGAAEDRWFEGTRYRVWGTGTPLVLIHGVGLTLEHWELLVPCLGAGHQIVAYDAIGHGNSSRPDGPLDMDAFVRQLDALTTHLRLDNFDILGYSMGALIAEGFVLRAPTRVRRLILLSGVYDRTEQERAAVLDRIVQSRSQGYDGYLASLPTALDRYLTPQFRESAPRIVERLMGHLRENDLGNFLDAYQFFGTADADLAPHVANIACPTLVITGEDDRRSTALMSRKLAACMPNARLEIMLGLRHMPTLEAPQRLADSVVGFLDAEDESLRDSPLADRRPIGSGSEWERKYKYSRALSVGNLVFVSGTTGFDYNTMSVAADVSSQTWQALHNIAMALQKAGASLREVVRVTYYLVRATDWEQVLAIHAQAFRDTCPTSSVVVCGLIDERMKIEIEATAVRASKAG